MPERVTVREYSDSSDSGPTVESILLTTGRKLKEKKMLKRESCGSAQKKRKRKKIVFLASVGPLRRMVDAHLPALGGAAQVAKARKRGPPSQQRRNEDTAAQAAGGPRTKKPKAAAVLDERCSMSALS